MALIGGSQVVELLQSYRLCWICGRFSGGKTSIAFRLANEYLKQGYKLKSNALSVWNDPDETIQFQDGMLKTVVIVDEGGLQMKSRGMIEAAMAFAAKMDIILLVPSFFPPVRAVQVCIIQPLFGFSQIGIPLTIYRWQIRMAGFNEKGYFAWLFPQEIYGIYSRQFAGQDCYEILGWLEKKVEEFAKNQGSDIIHKVDFSGWKDDILADAADTISDAAEKMASIPRRKASKKWL